MKYKKPYIATLEEVTIMRDGEIAVIRYKDKSVAGVNLKIGKEIEFMSDQELLDCHNHCIRLELDIMRNHSYVATEVPPGKPQIEPTPHPSQWSARGDVIRMQICVDDTPAHEVIFHIDDQVLTLGEFGRMLTEREGWGMRIMFVPDDELEVSPPIEFCDPDNSDQGSIMPPPGLISNEVH